jgi:ATP-binding cassette subfamily F protein 3
VHHGRARQYGGDLEDYRKLVLAADRSSERETKSATPAAPKAESKKPKVSAYTLKQRVAAAEAEIEQAQAALAHIDAALANPQLFAQDAARGQLLLKERADVAIALERAEAAWMEASEALEKALQA